MKPVDTRLDFVRLRADGLSYDRIAAELDISRDTCKRWEKDLRDKVATLKADRLAELHKAYHMTKEARIKRLGETLERIEDALAGADLSGIPPERLLDYKLKYAEALKAEYTAPANRLPDHLEPRDILDALGDLINRIREGEVTADQAGKESSAIGNLLKAVDAVDIKDRIDALEAILKDR